MKSGVGRLFFFVLLCSIAALSVGFTNEDSATLDAVNRHALKDNVYITDTYFLARAESDFDFFFEPLPDKIGGSGGKRTCTAFIQTIQTTDGGIFSGNGTTLAKVLGALVWPVAVVSGIPFLLLLWTIISGWLKNIGKPKARWHPSATLLVVVIGILFSASAMGIALLPRFQTVLFDNASNQEFFLQTNENTIRIPGRTYVEINMMCGTESLTLYRGDADKVGTPISLNVEPTKRLLIYNIDSKNTYRYASATYISTGSTAAD